MVSDGAHGRVGVRQAQQGNGRERGSSSKRAAGDGQPSPMGAVDAVDAVDGTVRQLHVVGHDRQPGCSRVVLSDLPSCGLLIGQRGHSKLLLQQARCWLLSKQTLLAVHSEGASRRRRRWCWCSVQGTRSVVGHANAGGRMLRSEC